jgi:cardiolipin synthase
MLTKHTPRIAFVAISALVAGCAAFTSLPPPPRLDQPPTPKTLSIIGPQGKIDRRTRERITQQLAKLGEDNLLGRHLAAMQTASPMPLIVGNHVRLLIDGPQAYAAIFTAIAAARDHINVEMFIFDEAQSGGRQLSDLLVAQANNGIAINVLYDSVGSRGTPATLFDKLRGAGVRLCEFNPLNLALSRTLEFTQRDHRKVVVVDGQLAFTGGINFSGAYSSGSRVRRRKPLDAVKEGWRDTQIEVEGPASQEIQRLFLQSWDKQRCPTLQAAQYLPTPHDAGDTLLRINASSVDMQHNETYIAALSAVTFAKSSIDLTMAYFTPDDQLEQALGDAAQRGVRVRLLLPGVSDFRGIVAASRAHYARLLKNGVQIFEEQSVLLHAKTLEVDGIWSTVGSANWDWLSFAHNDELNVVVIDTGFAAQMRTLFERDLERAKAITLSQWRKRPLRQRILERFWVTWERFL